MDKWIKENKITTTIVLALVLVFGVGYFYKGVSNIELQEKCSNQSKNFFDYRILSTKSYSGAFKYYNHYNKKLDKCFILIEHTAMSEIDLSTKDLFDANEKKQYGEFGINPTEYLSSGKGIWGCSIYKNGEESSLKTCKNEEEFDVFVNNYMEN